MAFDFKKEYKELYTVENKLLLIKVPPEKRKTVIRHPIRKA